MTGNVSHDDLSIEERKHPVRVTSLSGGQTSQLESLNQSQVAVGMLRFSPILSLVPVLTIM